MMEPSLDLLMRKVDSKYALVVMAAKRARQLMAGDEKLVSGSSEKPVTAALEEIARDYVRSERTARSGIK
ncbi:MAG: DNA-directed RNA polymerase subunit omega [Bacillota bacterium]|nr:DNA-directed RNA polymerase subunit omega [Bacillota bacterium]